MIRVQQLEIVLQYGAGFHLPLVRTTSEKNVHHFRQALQRQLSLPAHFIWVSVIPHVTIRQDTHQDFHSGRRDGLKSISLKLIIKLLHYQNNQEQFLLKKHKQAHEISLKSRDLDKISTLILWLDTKVLFPLIVESHKNLMKMCSYFTLAVKHAQIPENFMPSKSGDNCQTQATFCYLWGGNEAKIAQYANC